MAAIAGLPDTVVRRAKTLLDSPPKSSVAAVQVEPLHRPHHPMLFDPREMLLDSLVALNINTITPLEALELLARWQDELK